MAKIQRANAFWILQVEISFNTQTKGQHKPCLTAVCTDIIIKVSADLVCIQNRSERDLEHVSLRTVEGKQKKFYTLEYGQIYFLG